MKTFQRGILALLAATVLITPAFADIITAPNAPERKTDTGTVLRTLEQNGLDRYAALEKVAALTDAEIGFFSERPDALRIAGQQTEWYESWGGFLWLAATVAGTVWYINNH